MRYYVILLLVLAVPVIANQASIVLTRDFGHQVDIPDYFFRQSNPSPLTFNLSSQQNVTSVRLLIRTYACFDGSGCEANVCVQLDANTAERVCKAPPLCYAGNCKAWVEFTMTPRLASSIVISQPTTYASGISWLRVSDIEWVDTEQKTWARDTTSLRGTGPVNLGRIREQVDVANFTGNVFIKSDNAAAVAWLNDPFYGPSATSRNESASYNDQVFACINADQNVDSNGDPICDYIEENACAQQGSDWYAGYCCGIDSPYIPSAGCPWYSDVGGICGKNSAGDWRWAGLGDVGVVSILDGCPNAQLVSDGAKFYTCNQQIPSGYPAAVIAQISGRKTILGHEYVCQSQNIIECGGEAPYSPNAKPTGSSMVIDGDVQYCTSDGKWKTSLDGTDKVSCEKAGFAWTGTKCCGEQDDSAVFYEEPFDSSGDGTAGGCFNNTFVPSGGFVQGNKAVANYRGSFYVCDPGVSQGTSMPITTLGLFLGTGITPTAVGPCGKPLPNAIFTGVKQNMACMPFGAWAFTNETGTQVKSATKWVPPSGEESQGCCPTTQCWDGIACKSVDEYYPDRPTESNEDGYRCEQTANGAEWVKTSVKSTWDRKSSGFCARASQCLVSNAYNEEYDDEPDRYWSQLSSTLKPKCIADTQFISDNYCDNGKWSSRTKLAATQLLDVALARSANDFVLYCDSYDAVLNRYQYLTEYGPVTRFIQKHCLQPGNRRLENCANNMCVVKYGGTVGFGFSINTAVDGDDSPLKALDESASLCDNALNQDGDYDSCGNNVWYNHDTKGLLYLPGVTLLPQPSTQTKDYFKLPFDRLQKYVSDYVHKPSIRQYNYSFFAVEPSFKQVYMVKDGFDFVYGFRESNVTLSQRDYAGWYFSNINLPSDACNRIVKRYDDLANCEVQPSSTEFYVAAQKLGPKSIVDAWVDMTAKLRVKP